MNQVSNKGAIHVRFGLEIDGDILLMPTTELSVVPGVAADYGLMEAADSSGYAVVLDVLVAAHKLVYGSAFTADEHDEYLKMKSRHWLEKAFGKKAYYSGFTINGSYAYEFGSEYTKRGFKGLSIDKARVQDGDAIVLFAFQESLGMDYYTYFLLDGERVGDLTLNAGKRVELELEGLMYSYGGPMKRSDRVRHHLTSPVLKSQIVTIDTGSGIATPVEGAITDERDGKVEIVFNEPGEYYVSATGGKVRYNVNLTHPWLKVTVS